MKKVTIKAKDPKDLIRAVKELGLENARCNLFIRTENDIDVNNLLSMIKNRLNNIDCHVKRTLTFEDNIKAVFELN